jgi:hypothetical protein
MADRKSRPYLVNPGWDRRSGSGTYETGAIVTVTGIYLVLHSAHHLPHEVVAVKGHRFPKCQKCADSVFFQLLHPADDLFRHMTDIVYELPVIDEEQKAPLR